MGITGKRPESGSAKIVHGTSWVSQNKKVYEQGDPTTRLKRTRVTIWWYVDSMGHDKSNRYGKGEML